MEQYAIGKGWIFLLKPDSIYEVNIDACGAGGEGICHIEQIAVFVPGACEGDTARIQITKVKTSYAFARLLQVVAPSPHRQTPPCPVYGKCGGCQLMHLTYKKQLAFKKQVVIDALARIGHLDVSAAQIFDTIGMDPPARYRNKMVFPIGKKADGRITGGFYAPKSHHIIALSDCLLGCSFASACLSAVLTYMKEYRIQPYDEQSHTGLVRRLFVRTGYHTKKAMAVLSVNGRKLPKEQQLVELLRQVPSDEYHLSSILLNSNTERNNLVLGGENRVLFGESSIDDTLCGLSFSISPNSFYQVNPVQTEKLYETAISFAGLTGSETVLDLYCGIGTISLCAAKKAARVIGVEIVPQAVYNATENARRNRIQNAEFFTGKAEAFSEKLKEEGLAPDVVFLDPPRKGSDAGTLDAVLQMAPKQIVYISCNPATLARDLEVLAAGGYALKKVQPVDMFPHTAHVETIMLLQRRDT